MSKLRLILNFIGSIFPVVFPKNEFKPKRAVFVFLMVIAMMFAIEYFGAATIDQAIDLTGDIVELTEEAK